MSIEIATAYLKRAEEKLRLSPGCIIVKPWDTEFRSEQRAVDHLWILGQAYGGGHPGSVETPISLIERQVRGDMLTWLLYKDYHPVGMANLEINAGVAKLCRTCEVPDGTVFTDGQIHNGQDVETSAVAYQRLADALIHPGLAEKIWALEADLRLAKKITLPSGRLLEAGVITQHMNNALTPILLCVPRYQIEPDHGVSYQEVLNQSRRYLQPERVRSSEAIYTPQSVVGYNGVTIAEISKATYNRAFGTTPTINSEVSEVESQANVQLEHTAGIHYSTLKLEGDVSEEVIRHNLAEGINQSRFVEIVVENKPGNIKLQEKLYNLGMVPLGVKPGGTFAFNSHEVKVPTTTHFGFAKQETIRKMVQIELANDYRGTDIERLTLALREQWRLLAENYPLQ
jgi:hypothetical protein